MIEHTEDSWDYLQQRTQRTLDMHKQLENEPDLADDMDFRYRFRTAIKERDRAEKAHVAALREAYEQRLARQREAYQ